MDGTLTALFGLNGVILAGILYNSFRVGKLQGRLENGDYLRCPFYRKNRGNDCGKRNKSNTKTGSSR